MMNTSLVKIITFASLLWASTAYGKNDLSKDTEYIKVQSCSVKKIDELGRALNAYEVKISKNFESLSEEQLNALSLLDSFDADLLTYVRPDFIPSKNALASTSQSCWMHYEDFKKELLFGKAKGASENSQHWKNCLIASFKRMPKIVTQILSCYEKIK